MHTWVLLNSVAYKYTFWVIRVLRRAKINYVTRFFLFKLSVVYIVEVLGGYSSGVKALFDDERTGYLKSRKY